MARISKNLDLAFDDARNELSKEADEQTIVKLEAYIRGYFNKFDDFARETKTEIELRSGEDIGYIDCMIDGSFIVEDKTCSIFDADLPNALRMNDQIANYLWLASENGLSVEKVLYRETRKSLHKQTKAESSKAFRDRIMEMYLVKDDCYRQIELDPNVYDLENHKRTILKTNEAIKRFLEEWSYSPTADMPKNCWSCLGKFGSCEYLPICSASLERERYPDFYAANSKDPIDGGDFRIVHDILGEPKFGPDEIDNISSENFIVEESSKLAEFMTCFVGEKVDSKIRKIIDLYFNIGDFEVKRFIRKFSKKGVENDGSDNSK